MIGLKFLLILATTTHARRIPAWVKEKKLRMAAERAAEAARAAVARAAKDDAERLSPRLAHSTLVSKRGETHENACSFQKTAD